MTKAKGQAPAEESQGQARAARVSASAAQDKLVSSVMEDLTGVEERWLGGVRPFFVRLVAAAQSGKVSDEDFRKTIEAAHARMPELFQALDTDHLAESMRKAMGAAAVNGAVDGFLKRRPDADESGPT